MKFSSASVLTLNSFQTSFKFASHSFQICFKFASNLFRNSIQISRIVVCWQNSCFQNFCKIQLQTSKQSLHLANYRFAASNFIWRESDDGAFLWILWIFWFTSNFRSNCSQVLWNLGFLENFAKLSGKNLWRSFFLVNLQVSSLQHYLKRHSDTDTLLWILQNFNNNTFLTVGLKWSILNWWFTLKNLKKFQFNKSPLVSNENLFFFRTEVPII